MMKHCLLQLERYLILTPIAWTFIVLFNIPDMKHILSRITLVTALYCFFRFHKIWKVKLSYIKIRHTFICLLFIILSIYLFHIINESREDFARSMLYCLIYFLFLPIDDEKIKDKLINLVAIGGITSACILIFYQDVAITGRYSLALNPIPHAMYSSLSLLIIINFLWKKLKMNLTLSRLFYIIICILGIGGYLYSIYVSETRTAWFSLIIVSLCAGVRVILYKPTIQRLSGFISLFLLSLFVLYQLPFIQNRIDITLHNLSEIHEKSEYSSSIGARIQLWKSGIYVSQKNILFGLSRAKEKEKAIEGIKDGYISSIAAEYLYDPHSKVASGDYHNQYIQMLVHTGICGVFILLAYLGIIFFSGINTLNLSLFSFTALFIFINSVFLYNHTVYLYTFIIIIMCITNNKLKEDKT